MISLVPICVVFLLTARLKCFMCGGGGPCPVNRGGTCDCLMSLLAIIILFFIFRATGVLDKIFYNIGYAKAPTKVAKFVPTPGEITECSRNDSETETTTDYALNDYSSLEPLYIDYYESTTVNILTSTVNMTITKPDNYTGGRRRGNHSGQWTTILYYFL